MSELKRHLSEYVKQLDKKENPAKYSTIKLKEFKKLTDQKLVDMLKMVISELGYDAYSVNISFEACSWHGITFCVSQQEST